MNYGLLAFVDVVGDDVDQAVDVGTSELGLAVCGPTPEVHTQPLAVMILGG